MCGEDGSLIIHKCKNLNAKNENEISPDVLIDSASVEYLGFLLVQVAFLSAEDLKVWAR